MVRKAAPLHHSSMHCYQIVQYTNNDSRLIKKWLNDFTKHKIQSELIISNCLKLSVVGRAKHSERYPKKLNEAELTVSFPLSLMQSTYIYTGSNYISQAQRLAPDWLLELSFGHSCFILYTEMAIHSKRELVYSGLLVRNNRSKFKLKQINDQPIGNV